MVVVVVLVIVGHPTTAAAAAAAATAACCPIQAAEEDVAAPVTTVAEAAAMVAMAVTAPLVRPTIGSDNNSQELHNRELVVVAVLSCRNTLCTKNWSWTAKYSHQRFYLFK